MTPQAIAARRAEAARRALAAAPAAVRERGGKRRGRVERRGRTRRRRRPGLQLVERPPDADDADLGAAQGVVDRRHARRAPSGARRRPPATPSTRRPAAPTTAPTTCTCHRTSTIGSRTSSSTACARRWSARARQAQQLDRQSLDALVRVNRTTSITVTQRRRAGHRRRVQPGAAVRVRRAAALQRDDGRPGADDLDGRGEVEPRHRGAAVGGLAVRAAGRQDPRPDGRQPRRARSLHRPRVHVAGLVRAVRPAGPVAGASTSSCSSSSPT